MLNHIKRIKNFKISDQSIKTLSLVDLVKERFVLNFDRYAMIVKKTDSNFDIKLLIISIRVFDHSFYYFD